MGETNKIYPSNNFENITPNDSTDLLQPTRGILLGAAGAIAIYNEASSSVTLSNLAVGVIHPITTKRILSTGTIASGIVAFY